MESAIATFHDEHGLRAVPAAAAHEVTAVDTDAGVVASTTVRAGDAEARVLFAESR